MMSDKPLITQEMMEEWEAIQGDLIEMEQWEHHCRMTEPKLFIEYWEDWMRAILAPFVREIGPAVAINAACIHTFQSLMNRAFLMAYYFGCRRYEASVDNMVQHGMGIKKKTDKSKGVPKTGGFNPRDFLM